jgi:hypothetical protein
MRERVMEALRLHFKPEFLNRVDDILIFHRLTKEQLRKIVELQMARLSRLLADRNLTLELTDRARDFLADAGYDPIYGARPLRRAIQHHLQDKLAPMLLSGEFKEGDTILVDADQDTLTFQRQEELPGLRHNEVKRGHCLKPPNYAARKRLTISTYCVVLRRLGKVTPPSRFYPFRKYFLCR